MQIYANKLNSNCTTADISYNKISCITYSSLYRCVLRWQKFCGTLFRRPTCSTPPPTFIFVPALSVASKRHEKDKK